MKRKITAAAFALLAAAALAETTPAMVSLVTPVQAPSCSHDVTGFRLSLIYGDCAEFTGLDLGLAQHASGDFTGLALGGVNIAGGRTVGGQVGLVNWSCDADPEWRQISKGGQLGLLNYAGSLCGYQGGLVNAAGTTFVGHQHGLVNCTDDMTGLQCGFYFIFGVNIASGSVRGCQIGLFNYAETMECGLQIGLVNVIARNGWLPVLPLVNGRF